MSSTELTPEIIREWLQASCAAQGVPVIIRDRGVITQVATLLGHHHPQTRRVGGRQRSTDRASLPHQTQPAPVQARTARGALPRRLAARPDASH